RVLRAHGRPGLGRSADELALEQNVAEGRSIGYVSDGAAARVQPIGHRDPGMVEARARDLDWPDLEVRTLEQLAEGDIGLHRIERDGEIGIVGLRTEDGSEMGVVALPSVDEDAIAGAVERREERQPLDVVPVGVADEQVRRALAATEVSGHELFA